jgi:glycosyltransferase involved in cell wall biosynthesis
MTGVAAPGYKGRLYRKEIIDGVTHHWVWAMGGVHKSRARRAANYATFAASASIVGSVLPRPDVVWASSPPLSVGTVGRLLSTVRRRPWIFEVRDVWPESAVAVGWLKKESKIYDIMLRAAQRYSRGADGLLVATPGLVDDVQAHGGEKVTVVTGVVLDNPTDEDERVRVRRELGVEDHTCLFVYVGAHGVANRLDLLLDAVKSLDPDADAEFVLAGDGSDWHRLADRLATEKIPRIRMLGAVSKSKVREFLWASDVCLQPLRPDNLMLDALPAKTMEYFGAHRAFITTSRGLPQQAAMQSGGGFAESAEGLAEEISRWIAMPAEERRRRGEQSYEYGSREFGLERITDTLETLLDQVRSKP